MTPVEAIDSLDTIVSKANIIVNALAEEAHEVALHWATLAATGAGKREDHAAGMLMRLIPQLAALERFARNCQKQIKRFDADPFGREKDAT